MESKAYFGALLLNKHCTARLHREERRLDRQQKLMYNRVWREKELLMDDYIHINVRTPSPQRMLTSSPAASLRHRRNKSSSAAELHKHNASGVQAGSEESPSILDRQSHQCSKSSDPHLSEFSASVETLQDEIPSCSLESWMSRSLAEMTPTTFVPAVADEVDYRPILQEASNCEDSDHVAITSNRCGWDTHSTTETSFAGPEGSIKQLPQTEHKHATMNEATYYSTFKYTSQDEEYCMNDKESIQERASSTCDMNRSDQGSSSPRLLKSGVQKTVRKQTSSLSSRQSPISQNRTSPCGPRSSTTLGCHRKESLDDCDVHRKQRPMTCAPAGNTNRTKTDRWNCSTKKKELQLQDKSGRNSRMKALNSKRYTTLRSTDSDFGHKVPCHTDIKQEDSSRVPNARRNSFDKRTGQTKDQHSNDSKLHAQGTKQTKPNDTNEAENDHKNEHDVHQGSVEKSHPRAPKKLHVRQMTLDPKLVLPLSAKRYQCKKQATIIPVIAVYRHQATLYPNAEAKAGRVVTLDRRARGWMERSTSILFSLENIHSKPPKHVSSPSEVKPTTKSSHTEQQDSPDEVIPPKTTSSHDEAKSTHDAHVQNLTSSRTSSAKSLMSFPSQTVASSSDNDDDSSDVVLVPQTIYRDPDSPLFKNRFSQIEQSTSKTVQRQRKQRAKLLLPLV